MKRNRGKFLVGTSGYNYKHWAEGVFYPPSLPQNKWLAYYTNFFNTVELNVTFYRLPFENTFKSWYSKTPADFKFSIKGSRFITHIKRLNDCKDELVLFFQRASYLKEKLPVILWQLPASLNFNEDKFKKFCELLTKETKSFNFKNLNHAFEFRANSWFCEELYNILKDYNFSLCIAHSNRWPFIKQITSNLVYLRFHGSSSLYSSNYTEEELKEFSKDIKNWLSEGKIIYAYFNNDAYGFAINNAKRLKELVEACASF